MQAHEAFDLIGGSERVTTKGRKDIKDDIFQVKPIS
jgi:hypothetical protein